MKDLSTRARIFALIIIAALPALALAVINTARERAAAEARAHESIQQIAGLVAGHQELVVEAAREVLVALSQIMPELQRDQAHCSQYLANILKNTGGLYHSMGIHNADGSQFCNAVPSNSNVNLSDRSYFRRAMKTGKFSVGDYQIGRITKKAGINFGYPITDRAGNITGVSFLALDLHSFSGVLSAVPIPQYAQLSVLDRNGVVLAGYPEDQRAVGGKFQTARVLETVLANDRGITEESAGGEDRLYAYESVAEKLDGLPALHVLVSIPKAIIYADANKTLARSLMEIVLVTLLLLAGAWYGAELLILRRVRTILGVAGRVRQGDMGARTGMRNTRDEISQVGFAFDRMIRAVQTQSAKLNQVMQELHEQAITDTLTGLFNRRYLREVMERELAGARRRGGSIAMMMIDIDHFKKINDTFGHGAGDLVLRKVGALLKECIRASDIACRFGGEEFALVLPEASLDGASQRAEEIRSAISALDLQYGETALGKITASLGVAFFPGHADSPETLIRAADEALYEAKGAGRDRVVISRGKTPSLLSE
ncbi:MAG TPA: diguanylate cyclase [Burkholderiales bacterium]|nr:diguanylate cyclase [Burkholderiales bacterium]